MSDQLRTPDEPADETKEKPSVTLPATVEKIIPAVPFVRPEQAQISVTDGEAFYKEIRVENTLQDENGNPVALKPGADVQVTIEADKSDTVPKDPEDDPTSDSE